jgi:hypothetical protein
LGGEEKAPRVFPGGFRGIFLEIVPQYPFAGITRIRFQGSRSASPLSRIAPTPPLRYLLYDEASDLSNCDSFFLPALGDVILKNSQGRGTDPLRGDSPGHVLLPQVRPILL